MVEIDPLEGWQRCQAQKAPKVGLRFRTPIRHGRKPERNLRRVRSNPLVAQNATLSGVKLVEINRHCIKAVLKLRSFP